MFLKKMTKTVCVTFSKNEMYLLSVAYGISAMRKADSKVSLFRISPEDIDEKLISITELNPDIIVFHVSYHSYNSLKYCCEFLKHRNRNIILVVCNNVATCLAEELIREIQEIDFVVLGEFEETLEEIVRDCKTKEDIKRIKGVSYIDNGKYMINPIRILADVDKLEFPDRECYENNTRNFLVLGSRGCEGNCKFCDKNYLFKMSGCNKHRLRSIDSILKEVDLLVEKYNCKFVSFIDSSFCNAHEMTQRLNELYTKLKTKKYWVQFLFCLRCEQINEEVVQSLFRLREVGLSKVYVGIESFINTDLQFYNKRSDVQTNRKAIALLNGLNGNSKDYMLEIGYGFMIFNPYTTREQLRINFQSLCSNNMFVNPYIVTTRMSVSLLGTVAEQLEKDDLLFRGVNELSLEEKMHRRLRYQFQSEDVQQIYDIMMECVKIIDYKNFNGIEAIRNRYYHFWGEDSILEKLDSAYNNWKKVVDVNTQSLFESVLINSDSWQIVRKNAVAKSKLFKEELDFARNVVEKCKYPIAVRLQRIDELVYR